MTALTNQRVAFFNGRIVPESEVRISFRDRGYKYGDAVFDMTRTFNHRIFRLQEHIDRLYRSLRYVRIDPGIGPAEMMRLSEEILAQNLHLIGPADDYWVGQRVTRGVDLVYGEEVVQSGPTILIECTPLPLKARARHYRDGLDVVVPATRRVPPTSLSPRAKSHNYLNMILAEQEAKANNPDAWAILLDENGNLAEGIGSNIFLVRDCKVYTPSDRYVLPGVSRAVAMEMAAQLGLSVIEGDIDLFDAYTADEAFVTSTSFCICPVRSINGKRMVADGIPGPITKSLMGAYVRHVDFDWVRQYLRHLSD
jgi:branched-chain amino acid aminotransferase